MSTFPGSNVPTNASVDARVNEIVDNYLTPRLLQFRQINIFDETFVLQPDNISWKATFGNWLEEFDLLIRKNGKPLAPGAGGYNFVDYTKGTLEVGTVDVGPDNRPYDIVIGSYQFDYFTVDVLEGYIITAVDIVNTGAAGPPTNYTVDTMPDYWNGVVTDLAFAMAMERLILDYDLWKGRIIFTLGPSTFEEGGGGGDVVSQLETLKNNAEERANRTLDNEKFKAGNYLSAPTAVYYASIDGVGGYRNCIGGKLRGYRRNRYV